MTTPLKVHGADASHHQPDLDLKLAKEKGLDWLYHKATEGTSFKDPEYNQRRKQAKAAGLPFGAYHFARPEGPDAKAEARFFIETARPRPGDLLPCLDLEVPGNWEAWAKEFMSEVQRLCHVKGLHYGPNDFGKDYPFLRWVPRYNNSNTDPEVPWDIWQFSNGRLGVPNSFPGLGRMDLNHMRYGLKMSQLLIPKEAPAPKFRVVKFAHCSMQFSDSPAEMRHDVQIIFGRGYDVMTGTEAGPGADPLPDLLREEAEEMGYRFYLPRRPTDCWIAVHRDMIDGGWKTHYQPVIPGSSALEDELDLPPGKRWGPKGVVSVEFDNDELGHISVGAAHYLTDARTPKSQYWPWNAKLAHAIGDWADYAARGSNLAFYGGDQNMADSKNSQPQGDTFMGENLTSAWDELKKWENTGHGPIDVIASHDKDGRVEAKSIRALDDRELFLNMDHFLVEARYEVKYL